MEISIIFSEQPDELRSLKILKKVGDTKLSVYHTYCPSQRTSYALKVFPKDSFGTAQHKKEMLMSNLSHPNIVKYIPASIDFKQDDFYTILTEFAQFGELFDLVVKGALDSEILIRTYFHQLISGIEYIHSQGIAHLDLKLENLMLGEDFNLKIIDFDQAQRITDKRVSSGGTRGYRAPEIIDGSCRNLKAADIYSLGVILFSLKAMEYPFVEVTNGTGSAQCTDLKHYSTFTRDNKKYWEMKAAKQRDGMFFSEDFKRLVNGMLECAPEKRFTLEDIKESRWYNGPVLDGESLKKKMESVWEKYMRSEGGDMNVESA